MKTTDQPILVEQSFITSKEELWDSITNPEKMRKWFFENMKDFQPKAGFETQFPVQSEKRIFTHIWRVVEVIPGKKITLNWKYKEYPGESRVTFEMVQNHDRVKLNVNTVVLKDFPESIPEFTIESCRGGWEYFINYRLKNYLSEIGNANIKN